MPSRSTKLASHCPLPLKAGSRRSACCPNGPEGLAERRANQRPSAQPALATESRRAARSAARDRAAERSAVEAG
jgi:hypothetical protein